MFINRYLYVAGGDRGGRGRGKGGKGREAGDIHLVKTDRATSPSLPRFPLALGLGRPEVLRIDMSIVLISRLISCLTGVLSLSPVNH